MSPSRAANRKVAESNTGQEVTNHRSDRTQRLYVSKAHGMNSGLF